MKLTILFVVVVGAILVWWLKSVKAKQDLTPTRRAARFMRSVLSLAAGRSASASERRYAQTSERAMNKRYPHLSDTHDNAAKAKAEYNHHDNHNAVIS